MAEPGHKVEPAWHWSPIFLSQHLGFITPTMKGLDPWWSHALSCSNITWFFVPHNFLQHIRSLHPERAQTETIHSTGKKTVDTLTDNDLEALSSLHWWCPGDSWEYFYSSFLVLTKAKSSGGAKPRIHKKEWAPVTGPQTWEGGMEKALICGTRFLPCLHHAHCVPADKPHNTSKCQLSHW